MSSRSSTSNCVSSVNDSLAESPPPPWNHLPPELLCRVFWYLVDLTLPTNPMAETASLRDLITVTHVSRWWREAALAASELWSRVLITRTSLTAPDQLRAFLERSGTQPLDVFQCGVSRERVASLLGVLVPYYESRLRSLSWTFADKLLPKSIVARFPSPAPHLEKLELILGGTGTLRIPQLFGGQIPRLRELSLCRVHPGSANRFRGLTFLALSQIHIDPGLVPLLEILHDSPLLLDLALDSIRTGSAPPGEADRPPIPLRHLKRLHLANFQPQHTVRLLQTLELPMGVAMRFTDACGGTRSPPVPFPPELSLQTTTKFEIIFPPMQHVIYHSISPHAQTRIELTSGTRQLVDFSWIFKRLFRGKSPVIKELWIFAYRTTMYEIGPLHLLDSLETLVVQKNPEHSCHIDLYASLSPMRSPDRPWKVPCPHLTTLDLSVNRDDRLRLLGLLKDRAAAGSKLKTLRLLRSQIPQPHVASFSGCVDVLELLDEHERPRRMGLPEVCLEVGGNWWKPWGHDF